MIGISQCGIVCPQVGKKANIVMIYIVAFGCSSGIAESYALDYSIDDKM